MVRYLFTTIMPQVAKAIYCYPVIGLYSGVFAMYLQHHTCNINKGNNMLFYALCLLYFLSTATIVFDLAAFLMPAVSKDV